MSDKWKNALFWAVSLILVAGTVFLISSGMLPFAAVLCVAPLLGFTMVRAFDNRLLSLSFILIADFCIPVLEHYLVGMSMGLLMDAMICFNLAAIACSAMNGTRSTNVITLDLFIAIGIWLIYCIVELLNPNMRSIGVWLSAVRSMALYFFMVAIIVELSVTDFKQVMTILAIW